MSLNCLLSQHYYGLKCAATIPVPSVFRPNVAMVDLLSGEVVQFSPFLRLEWTATVAIGYEGRFSYNGPSLDSSPGR